MMYSMVNISSLLSGGGTFSNQIHNKSNKKVSKNVKCLKMSASFIIYILYSLIKSESFLILFLNFLIVIWMMFITYRFFFKKKFWKSDKNKN